jgi:hypothetical protein
LGIVNPIPTVTVNSPTVCNGSIATVTATPYTPGNYKYTWEVPTGATPPGNKDHFDTSVAGDYKVTIKEDNYLCNTDFENNSVIVGPNQYKIVDESEVPCWHTTAGDGKIEVWGTGFSSAPIYLGTPAYSGINFIELNANRPSTLYQDFKVRPGSKAILSFAHRGRPGSNPFGDAMQVEIGPVGGPYTDLGTFVDDASKWGYYSLKYTFPYNGVTDYSLRFKSVFPGGAEGNLLDAISISIESCSSLPAKGTVTVNTIGQVNQPIAQVVCNGVSNPKTAFATTNTGGTTTYRWFCDTQNIGLLTDSGDGDVPDFTARNTTVAPIGAKIMVTPTFNFTINEIPSSCPGPSKKYAITIEPTALVDNPENQVVCNGVSNPKTTFTTTNIGGTTTYRWSSDTQNIGLLTD